MILQANKKFIDTSHVAHLLTAGEKYADKLVFSVERFYQETDLSGCLFVMRGVNSAGNLALETLSQEVMETEIRLTWNCLRRLLRFPVCWRWRSSAMTTATAF